MSSNMRSWGEKRDFIRMAVEAPIQVTDEAAGSTIQGICKDLSGTGLSIEIGESIASGTELRVYLASPNPGLPSFDAQVRVVRCTPADEQRFLMGVEILRINE